MYEYTEDLRSYYEELDYGKRESFFTEYRKKASGEETLAFREKVFKMRYPAFGKKSGFQDQFLIQILYYLGAYEKRNSFLTNLPKEIKKGSEKLGLTLLPTLSEEEKSILYFEIYNAAALYFSTCRDGGYGKKLLGLVQANDEEKRRRASYEAWILVKGIPKIGGESEDLQFFSEAVYEAYAAFEPEADKMLMECGERQSKKAKKSRFRKY